MAESRDARGMSGQGYDRRRVAGGVAAAALLPFTALGIPLTSAVAAARARVAPAGRFSLERVLRRELGDGALIVVTRRWRIGFAAAEPGLLVAGEQIFADVAAPAALSPLAALEKARRTVGMFPISLDPEGLIADSERTMDAAQLLRAIEAARAMVERQAGGAEMNADARTFMGQLARMGADAVSNLPRDLFFPATARSTATREIALPRGGHGVISVITDARADAETGLLQASERVIVTSIGDSARTSKEGWSLTRIG